jgi:G6PDH family F420-dependent oxidoreductase
LPNETQQKTQIEIALDLGETRKDPGEFKELVVLADRLGFEVAWLGDHFMPWTHSGNRSSFAWSLIASSLESTRRIKVGPYVTTPIGARYHPLLVAQASATLDNMYPGRFVLGVGTGEAVNESPFVQNWPRWKERMERLVEGVDLMRRLWESESYFDFDGRYFRSKQIFLFTKPKTKKPDVYFSAVGPKSAAIAGEHGDGLITLGSRNPLEKLRGIILPSFDEGARRAGKDPSRMKKIISFGFTFEDEKAYLQRRRRTAGNLARGALDEPDPRKIENMGQELTDEQLIKSTYFCSSWSEVVEMIHRFGDIGFSQIVLESGPDAEAIKSYSENILPYFATTIEK